MSLLDNAKDKLFTSLGLQDQKPIKDATDQPQQDLDLCDWVKKRVEESRSSTNRVAHEGIWMTNVAFLLGFDSVYYDTQQRQFRPTNAGSSYLKRNRIYSNQILPAAQNRLARLCKVPPRYDVRPNTTQPDDRDAARLGLEVLTDIWDRQEINRKRLNLMMWVQECGHSYLKAVHDDTLGEPLVDPVEGTIVGYTGEIRVDVVSAFEVFPDPLAKTFDELTWIAHCKVRTLDYFKQQYGEKGALVKPEGPWLLSAQYEARINTLNSIGPSAGGSLQEQMKNAAIEIAYYEKKSTKHPRGRMVVVANGVLLDDKELPAGEIPLVKFDDILVSGKYYPESVITHARPIQQQYNRVLGKRAEWVNKMLAGKYLAEKRHGLIKEALNDRSGEVVEYDLVQGAPPPGAIDIPVMPSYAFEESSYLKNELFEIFGLSEVSRGQIPASGIPAVGMQLLVEQDETRIGVEVEQHEHAYAQLGRLILKLASETYTTKRKLKVKSKDGNLNIKEWKGADLKNNTDVVVVRGSTIPTSKAMRRQEILNAYERGLLGDPADPAVRERTLGMLEFGDMAEIWRDRALDMTQIKESIDSIEKGVPPEVNELDNHTLHIQEKNAFRKSDRFQQLPPPIQDLLLEDIEQHVNMQMKLTNPGLQSQKQEVQKALNDAGGPLSPDEMAMADAEMAAQGVAPEQEMAQTEPNQPTEAPQI